VFQPTTQIAQASGRTIIRVITEKRQFARANFGRQPGRRRWGAGGGRRGIDDLSKDRKMT
jgi:hypothetical protein